jgi:transcriptional regulator with XRE-family HTH domain
MRTKLEILVAFGEIVREARKAKSLSQEQLADRAGLHRTYIGMIERGEKNLTLTNIAKVAQALEMPLHTLVTNLPA